MKILFVALALVGLSTTAFAQGTVVYYNRVTGSVVALIYGIEPANQPKHGNTVTGMPTGSQTYFGSPLSGTGFTATLWAGPANTPENSLVLVPDSARSFRTGGFAGTINNAGGSIAIPGVDTGFSAALQLRVWDNQGGTITSWGQVMSSGSPVYGSSLVFNSVPLGGSLTPPPPMQGLTSFNLVIIPEPRVVVLSALTGLSLLASRHRR